jgi:polyhydroxyalkanoate synthase
MHSEYLYGLYLNDDLANGRFKVEGEVVQLSDLKVPMFVVGTETDHVAPWASVYKIDRLTDCSEFTFLLTSGGHNAGIVSGPQNPKRRHRSAHWQDAASALAPEDYLQQAELRQGSWWPTWQQWLASHSAPDRVPPPPLGNPAAGLAPREDAPGTYVRA